MVWIISISYPQQWSRNKAIAMKFKPMIKEIQISQLRWQVISATALYDTEASMSHMSYTSYTKLKDHPPLQNIHALFEHSSMGHNLCPMGLIHCGVMPGNSQFRHSFIVCKNIQKELIIGLDMQLSHHLGCGWTEGGYMYLHQEANALNNSTGTVIDELHLWTISNIEIPTHSIATIPT